MFMIECTISSTGIIMHCENNLYLNITQIFYNRNYVFSLLDRISGFYSGKGFICSHDGFIEHLIRV